MSRRTVQQSPCVGLLALAAALVCAAPAAADAPTITSVSATVSGKTVTVSGTWLWTTHKNDCVGRPLVGVGVGVDWEDVNEPGNHVTTLGTESVDVGTPTDNTVHGLLGEPGTGYNCGTWNGTHNEGTFSGMTHTYTGALPSSICAVVYDSHGQPDGQTAGDETAGGPGHNVDNSVEFNEETPDGNVCSRVQLPGAPVPSTAQSSNPNPAISLGKSGPSSATAGADVAFALTATNPGDQPLSGVAVTDSRCDAVAPVLQSANGADGNPDGSPGTLDPGDVWTFVCSAHTATSDSNLHNDASVTGTAPSGATVNAVAATDVPLFTQAVEPLLPGSARLRGPSGCIASTLRLVSVTGRRIKSVAFSLDGRHVGTRDHPNRGSAYTMKLRGNRLRVGAHRVTARVTFKGNTNPGQRTLHLSVARCAVKVKPTFTG